MDITIGSLEEKRIVKARALADTGATFTTIPVTLAEELNLTFVGEKMKVSTAKGYGELDLTYAVLETDGKRRIMPVLVSGHIYRVLLGVITIQAMQLRLNPLTEKLEEYTALLY